MSKVKYVTGNIHKIGDLGQDHPHTLQEEKESIPGEPPSSAAVSPVSPSGTAAAPASTPGRARLSAVTEEALQRRHEEFLRFRRDLLFRMEELACNVKNTAGEAERLLQELHLLEEELKNARTLWDSCTEPDGEDPRYQVILAEKCRKMDQMRLTVIQLESRLAKNMLPFSGGKNASEKEMNLFAQMNSLTRKQLLRLGFWISLPSMLILLFSALLVGLFVLATFRVGL